MLRHERIKCPTKLITPDFVQDNRERIEYILGRDTGRDDFKKLRGEELLFTATLLAIQSYLLETDETRHWAEFALENAEDYFFGNWRDEVKSGDYLKEPPSRNWWDTNGVWADEFQFAVFNGSILCEWKRLEKFGYFLQDNIRQDIEQSAENRAWLLTVGRTLCGKEWNPNEIEQIRNGKKKRELLLLEFLEAILKEDDRELDARMSDYFNFYKQRELPKPELDNKVAMDGTFLYHFAHHRGRNLTLPKGVEDHVIPLC